MNRVVKIVLLTVLASGVALVSGCGIAARVQSDPYAASAPVMAKPAAPETGAIWSPTRSLTLFDDLKARQVGDTLTIRLAERTQASKSASTDAKRESTIDLPSPTLLGGTVTRNGDDILNNAVESEQEFAGEGSSSQSNRLDGNVTVTVAEVLPNGNLYVRGEKRLTLNQGEEYVQVTGIVRPSDIGADNSVPSFKVADARITYSGNGVVGEANRPGLLARLFMKFWPL